MYLYYIFLLYLYASHVLGGEANNAYEDTINLVKEFYESKSVSLLTAYVCWGEYERKLVRSMSYSGIRVNFAPVPTALLSVLQQDNYYRVGVLVDLACRKSRDALVQASLKKLFNLQKLWLLLESGCLSEDAAAPHDSNTSYAVVYSVDNHVQSRFNTNFTYHLSKFGNTVLSNLRILPDCEVTWVQLNRRTRQSKELKNGNLGEPDVLLLDVYKTSTVQPLNVSIAGLAFLSHKDEEGCFRIWFARRAPTTRRRSDLHGALFKTATVILFPDQFTDWNDLSLRHVDKWSKIHWPIFGYLRDQLNFSFEVTYQLDSYGWLTNGTFDGMMGYLQREEVEYPTTGVFIRQDRLRVASYAAPTFPLRATTIFRQPSLSTVSNIFTLPFDKSVWQCCIALCLSSVFTLGIQIIWTVRQHIEQDMVHATWSDMFTLVLGAICQQGYHLTPTSLSGRTTVFILTLSSLFLFTSYSAKIVALLQTPSVFFKTIHDLTNSPMITGVENQTYNGVFLKETTDPELREFYHRKIEPLGQKAYRHAATGMADIKKPMHAFQVDSAFAYKFISETYEEHEKCDLKEINLFPAPMCTIATAKGSFLREYFSQRVVWYRNVGLLDRLFKIWMPQKATCVSNVGGFVSVGMIEFYPAMTVLQYGTALAVVILLLEVLYFHRYNAVVFFIGYSTIINSMKLPFYQIVMHAMLRYVACQEDTKDIPCS